MDFLFESEQVRLYIKYLLYLALEIELIIMLCMHFPFYSVCYTTPCNCFSINNIVCDKHDGWVLQLFQ